MSIVTPQVAPSRADVGSERPAPPKPIPLQTCDVLDRARAIGGRGRMRTLAAQIARTVFRLGFATGLAVLVGGMIESGTFSWLALAAAAIGLAAAAAAGFCADWEAARAEAHVVNGLRTALGDALDRMPPQRVRSRAAGQLIAGLQRHPERLASLVISHAAAKSMLALGPLLTAAAVSVVSWQAALTLLSSIPVMLIFFVLLGGAVRSSAQTQEHAFGKLAAQFSDRIRTLPTILANHGLEREHGKIERRMLAYAESTMQVLKVAFLNAGVIDLFSALSIAVLAVFLGLGHLGLLHIPGFFGLQLWQSLFILVIAADFFMPFRRFAEQYHMKAEGETAAKELDWYFDTAATPVTAELSELQRIFADAIARFDVGALPATGLVVISGPSGAGKSTLLRMLAGIETPPPGFAPLPRVTTDGCVWMSTDIYVPGGTLAEVIAWNDGAVDRATLRRAVESVGLIDDKLLPGGLEARIAEGGANLSGGQRLRIGIARILISSGVVFADEPTAKLDPATATLIRSALSDIARHRLVIVASHDDRLIEIADRHHILSLPAHRETIAA